MSGGPRYAVHLASIPQVGPEEGIALVARSGATGVGLVEGQLESGRYGAYQDAIAEHGLTPTFFVPTMWTFFPVAFGNADTRTDPRERTELICASIPRLAPFKPEAIIVGPGTSGDPERPVGPVDAVIEGMVKVADVAREYGMRIGFELLAQRRGSPLHSLPLMIDALDAIDRDNVGIMFDFFHSWSEPDVHERLRRYAGRINSVQVNDIKHVERAGADREPPGAGRRVAPAMIAALRAGGYDGWWELELLSDDGRLGVDLPDSYWKLPAEELLRISREGFLDSWAESERLLAERKGRS